MSPEGLERIGKARQNAKWCSEKEIFSKATPSFGNRWRRVGLAQALKKGAFPPGIAGESSGEKAG